MTQEESYKTRFTFHLLYFNGKSAEELTTLNFFATPKEFAKPESAVENSIEITESFTRIAELFHNHMKQLTIENLYRNYDEDFYGVSPSTNQNPDACYIFKLIDHNASIREDGKLSAEKEVRVIYEQSVSAVNYINPYNLSILPIWKDQDDSDGIRSILKDLLSRSKYTNRFKKTTHRFTNVSTAFTLEV